MTDADDPWANHIRGTPLAEGSDPLSTTGNDRWNSGVNGNHKETNGEVENAGKSTLTKAEREIDDLGESSLLTDEGEITQDFENNDITDIPVEAPQSNDISDPVDRVLNGQEMDETVTENGALDDTNGSEEESDEEAFIYPGANTATSTGEAELKVAPNEDTNTLSQVPSTSNATETLLPVPATTDIQSSQDSNPPPEPRPVDYARLSQLCSQGPLSTLQKFISVTTSPAPSGSGISLFALANEPNPSNGLVPIHFAAREGRVDILKWLIREAGALVEMEDREGETALHKAAMAGKLPSLTFLISSGASANSVDGDGWTPLHNACSKGFLDIVKVLVENAEAAIDVKGGRGGWTPLMNAASNGHLPIVRYLTSKQKVDPFVRNNAGETAYDVAAATFEVFICEILEKYESERWAALKFAGSAPSNANQTVPGQGPYNPLSIHTTVPVIVYENQRLDTRLSTLAIRGGKPRWSGTQAGRPDKPDRRAPSTMSPGPLSLSRTRHLPMAREDIKLPTRSQPYKLRLPNRSAQIAAAKKARGEFGATGEEELGSTPTPDSVLRRGSNDEDVAVDSVEPSHFWLSTWQNDLTSPQVDAESGWQYSQSFDTPDERWSASVPAPLTRLLEGRGLGASVQRAVSSVVLASTGAAPVAEAEAVNSGWVRRRRWVRAMRRRLDIAFNDDLEAAEQSSLGAVTQSPNVTTEAQRVFESSVVLQAQADARNDAQQLGSNADYMARAKAMAGSGIGSTPANMDENELERRLTRIELAITELRQHAFSDADGDRQQRAEELLKEYTVQIGQLRQAAGLDEESEDSDDDSDAEFIYPNSYRDDGQSVITRIGGGPFATTSGVVPDRPSPALRQSSTASVFGERAAPSEAGTSLGAIRSADLAAASEFRVPTNEQHQRHLTGNTNGARQLREQSMIPIWEDDAEASTCRGCNRKFTFFLRKHHCRRCGRIFCDACSTHRAKLTPEELIIDPGMPEMILTESNGPSRICDGCDAERRLPSSLRNSPFGSEDISNAVHRMDIHSSASQSVRQDDVSSRASELADCPVCGLALAGLGEDAAVQEEHVRACLENGGGGTAVQGGKYLVYRLDEGPIVGKECQICLEEMLVNMTIARLPCLCYFHRHCIDSWLSRAHACPVHAR
ncbi:hypothetical protein L7F22_043953 [Adiantum nelumboides]|nr:hypothetical protein [Adiantum nelumboides]